MSFRRCLQLWPPEGHLVSLIEPYPRSLGQALGYLSFLVSYLFVLFLCDFCQSYRNGTLRRKITGVFMNTKCIGLDVLFSDSSPIGLQR